MGELHILGEIKYFTDYKRRVAGCRWSLTYGSKWEVLSGCVDSRTQYDEPYFGDQNWWSSPVDIHLGTSSIEGWPQFVFKVLKKDFELGTLGLVGYGSCHMPCVPGQHQLTCYVWKPIGVTEDINAYESTERFQSSSIWGNDIRHQLLTKPVGTISIDVTLIFKNFKSLGLEYKMLN